MKYAITGVTGNFGKVAALSLLGAGVLPEQIIGIARNPKKEIVLSNQGIEIRQADFDDKSGLELALRGIDKVLLVSTGEPDASKRFQQHVNVIDAAKKNGVSLIVYTSAVNPEKSPLGQAHVLTEQYIKESGLPYIILRNGYYMEVKFRDLQTANAGKPIVTNVGSGQFGMALRREYAETAANCLLSDNYKNIVFDLSSNMTNYIEFAKEIEKIIAKEVVVKQVSDQEYEELLSKIVSVQVAHVMSLTNASIREGALLVEKDDFEKLLKRPATSIYDGLRELWSENPNA